MKSQKDKFKIPEDISYLNTAYMSPLLKSVEKIGIEAVSKKCLPYEITGNDFFEPVNKLKKLFAELIQAPSSESIAIIPSSVNVKSLKTVSEKVTTISSEISGSWT